MAYKSFYDLDAWKLARAFKLKIYTLLKRFPADEKYDLTSQLRRAIRSIPANIAEGHGRKTPKDEIHFCITARGSLSETLNHLIDAYDCGYISKDELLDAKVSWDELRRTLLGYISYLETKLPSNKQNTNPVIREEVVAYLSLNEIEDSLEAFYQKVVESQASCPLNTSSTRSTSLTRLTNK